MNTQNSLTAGVARVDITPPVGLRLQGALRRTEPSTGIELPLFATALVLADAAVKCVIMDCDLLGFDRPRSDDFRAAIGARVGVPASRVWLCTTHTHNGPVTCAAVGGTPPGESLGDSAVIETYLTNLKQQLAGVAAMADAGRVPARAGAGRAEAKVGINREEHLPEGRTVLGRNPAGPADHSVDVLRIDRADGSPLALITGYAAHPVVMGWETYLISPDYPGIARSVAEQATGATCLFLTGAAGNQATIEFLQNDWDEMRRIGAQVGCAAGQAFHEIETRPHEVIRNFDASLSSCALYSKKFSAGAPTHERLLTAQRRVGVPLQPLPSLQIATQRFAEATANIDKLRREGAPMARIYPAGLVQAWNAGVMEKVKAGVKQESLEFDISGLRLDDFTLLGMPGEPFVQIGLEAKRKSSTRRTMFAGYCNGIIAYWPDADTVANGTAMSVTAAVVSYAISAPPVAENNAMIGREFERLLAELDAGGSAA